MSAPLPFSIQRLDRVDSTNTYLMAQAALGAPAGRVVIAGEQTGGRGRFGRSFASAAGKGLYLSLLLRPDLPARELTRVTPWAAVAVCRAVEELTGLSPAVKWVNDLLLDGRKLCGILTEGEITPEGRIQYLVLGIGLNLLQTPEDFPPPLGETATSLAQHLSAPPCVRQAEGAVLTQLARLCRELTGDGAQWLEEYRRRCVTVGRAVRVRVPGSERVGRALGVEEDFSLKVDFPGTGVERVRSGEVSLGSLD